MRNTVDGGTYPLATDTDVSDRVEHAREARLFGRVVRWQMTPAAHAAAARLTAPLVVEMELYFSCLVRKAVRFYIPDAGTGIGEEAHLTEHLRLRFRAVTTQHCVLPAGASEPPVESMPVSRPHAFVPRRLRLDYRHGVWSGEFGY